MALCRSRSHLARHVHRRGPAVPRDLLLRNSIRLVSFGVDVSWVNGWALGVIRRGGVIRHALASVRVRARRKPAPGCRRVAAVRARLGCLGRGLRFPTGTQCRGVDDLAHEAAPLAADLAIWGGNLADHLTIGPAAAPAEAVPGLGVSVGIDRRARHGRPASKTRSGLRARGCLRRSPSSRPPWTPGSKVTAAESVISSVAAASERRSARGRRGAGRGPVFCRPAGRKANHRRGSRQDPEVARNVARDRGNRCKPLVSLSCESAPGRIRTCAHASGGHRSIP